MLNMTVFLMTVTSGIPPTDQTPILSIYYATVMVLTTAATVLGVIVLRLHHQVGNHNGWSKYLLFWVKQNPGESHQTFGSFWVRVRCAGKARDPRAAIPPQAWPVDGAPNLHQVPAHRETAGAAGPAGDGVGSNLRIVSV